MTIAVAKHHAAYRPAAAKQASTPISSVDLTRLLVLDGAQVVSSDEHGAFVRAHHRLIFVRRASHVASADLRDALRIAQVGPGRFDILLEMVRATPPEA